jgi:CheY-like chemotaxis protein
VLAEREVADASMNLPIVQAALQVTLDAGRGLVSLLRRLGEQLHDKLRERRRDSLHSLAGRHRPPCDMAVDPLHGVGRGERRRAREHLIERDAERMEVAARIDRAVHPPGLLGRHIGQRACGGLGPLERLPFARKPRGDAEAGEPHLVGRQVCENVGWLDVLMDMPAMTGVELYRRLTEEGRAIPTILITAYPVDAVRARVLNEGVVGYLRKPFCRDDLRLGGVRVCTSPYMTGYSRNAIMRDGRLDPGVDLLGKPFSLEEPAAKVRGRLDAAK